MTDENQQLLALSAQIVAAHAGHNEVETDAIPHIIRSVYQTLADLRPDREEAVASDQNGYHHDAGYHNGHAHGHNGHDHDHDHAQDAHIHPDYGQTVFGDHLICMEDGLSMKMLKRHLITVHGMTPEDYRAKWGLPDDYPMVAADYAKLRSSLALQSGLGLKPEDRSIKSSKRRRG